MRAIAVRLASAALLALGLAGCVDAKIDIDLTSGATAVATTTQVINADLYALERVNAARKADDARKRPAFCADGVLTETADGGARCVLTQSGRFARLTLGLTERLLVFTPVAPGKVRIALPVAALRAALAAAGESETEAEAVLQAMLSGHALTLRFAGADIEDTNMTLARDGKSVTQTLPLLDLIDGTSGLPVAFYAIVEAPGR